MTNHLHKYKESRKLLDSTKPEPTNNTTPPQIKSSSDTMAEDSEPFTGYNKANNNATTLVGNWQEERSLADLTGIARYETQEQPSGTSGLTVTKMGKL
jgi:hypothetical protein